MLRRSAGRPLGGTRRPLPGSSKEASSPTCLRASPGRRQRCGNLVARSLASQRPGSIGMPGRMSRNRPVSGSKRTSPLSLRKKRRAGGDPVAASSRAGTTPEPIFWRRPVCRSTSQDVHPLGPWEYPRSAVARTSRFGDTFDPNRNRAPGRGTRSRSTPSGVQKLSRCRSPSRRSRSSRPSARKNIGPCSLAAGSGDVRPVSRSAIRALGDSGLRRIARFPSQLTRHKIQPVAGELDARHREEPVARTVRIERQIEGGQPPRSPASPARPPGRSGGSGRGRLREKRRRACPPSGRRRASGPCRGHGP